MFGGKIRTGKPWLDVVLGIVFAAVAFPVLLVAALLPLGITEPDYARGVIWGIAVMALPAILLFVSRWYRGMSLMSRVFWPALLVSWAGALITCSIVLKNMYFGF